jgi:hypothetical protein
LRRSRAPPARSDGTEKIAVPESATVGDLRRLLETQLKVPYADQTLSLDQRLVRPACRRWTHAAPARRMRRSAARGGRSSASLSRCAR